MNRRISDYLKTIFFAVIILQFIPPLYKSFKEHFMNGLDSKAKVGVIPIKDMIYDSSDSIKYLKKFFKDPNIKAIVLNIDSSGGTPGAAQAIFGEILALKKHYSKPIIAFSQDLCASAAYYIACAADAIVMQPATLVGSIGSFIGVPSVEGLMDQLKVKYNIIKAGEYKTAGSPFKDLTPEQRAMLQSVADDSYAQFVADVKAMRPRLAELDYKVWAEGKVFTGRQAKELGLVDELGAQTVLEQVLRSKGVAHQQEILWVHPPKPSAFSKLFGKEDNTADEGLSVSASSHSFIRTLVETFLRPYYL